MEQPIVTINEGKIRGYQRINLDGEKFYSFLAIPYGKPPIGELRFKAPKPVESWNGIKDATKEGNISYQGENLQETGCISTEDCLHLHVFTKNMHRVVKNEAMEIAVLEHVELGHTESTRQLAEVTGVSRSSIIRILKAHKLHPYKTRFVQDLNEHDPDGRLQFCKEMSCV